MPASRTRRKRCAAVNQDQASTAQPTCNQGCTVTRVQLCAFNVLATDGAMTCANCCCRCERQTLNGYLPFNTSLTVSLTLVLGALIPRLARGVDEIKIGNRDRKRRGR
jgi:hypothetical protein